MPNADEVDDLGITVTADLKPSARCRRVVARAYHMFSVIKLAFKFLDASSFTQLYISLVLPILDYYSVVRNPLYVRDIEALEKVQRHFTSILLMHRDLR